MNISSALLKFLFFWGLALCFLMQSAPDVVARNAVVDLVVNQGRLQKISAPVSEVLITNPDIADVQVTRSSGLFIFGKTPGRTQMMALGQGGETLFDATVTVARDLTLLDLLLRHEFPDCHLEVKSSPGRIILSGMARTPVQAQQIVSVVDGFLGKGDKVVNRMQVLSPAQVNIRVRIVEMNREATKNLGINWDVLLNPGALAIGLVTNRWPALVGGRLTPDPNTLGSGASGSIGYSGSTGSATAVIDALAEDNLVTILAEPNLTSKSGETASFFAGGEFPIPISADNNRVTVTYKKFGVILDITPTVLSGGKISIHIRPEVSEISDTGAVVINNFRIPGISVRRTEATIELASGQSFAVAGLLQNQTRNLIDEVPGLSDLAVLGPLFRSSKYRNKETELVIIATANIVAPPKSDAYALPTDGYRPNDTMGKMLTGNLTHPSLAPEMPEMEGDHGLTLKGPAGYIY
ncbi:MAG: type II and III secretion system protein family protein [Alphaproteobacteria bacterium]|nr:MAG: type II and III secretion system protein family protein [Alphaproteobacteria bacterium]